MRCATRAHEVPGPSAAAPTRDGRWPPEERCRAKTCLPCLSESGLIPGGDPGELVWTSPRSVVLGQWPWTAGT
jgi:hypothetical protein